MKNYIENIKSVSDKNFDYAKELLDSKKYDLKKLDKSTIPIEKGIYIFYSKDNKIVYVGSATGKKGLQQRIKQHLNPKYIDKKENKEKSTFREQIISDNPKLEIGQEVIEYIIDNFDLSYKEIENEDMILLTELLLIKGIKPIYNDTKNKEDKKVD